MSDSDDPPKCDLYVRYRLQGYGLHDAGKRAGFSEGRPSPRARRLWKIVQQEQGCDTAQRTLRLQKDVSQLKYELKRKKLRLRAVQALRTWELADRDKLET